MTTNVMKAHPLFKKEGIDGRLCTNLEIRNTYTILAIENEENRPSVQRHRLTCVITFLYIREI
jgi:hypothetical protein